MSIAILLIAHGSRRAEANADLLHVAAAIRGQRPEAIVVPSYLELADPDIPAGAASCVEQGATEVRMLPYFLSAGSHVTRDLERYREQFSEKHSGVEFVLCPPMGLHPLMIDVLLDRLDEG